VSAGSGRRASVSDPALNSELRAYFSQLLLGARCQLCGNVSVWCTGLTIIIDAGHRYSFSARAHFT
jgi:hypothetical protein